MMWSHQQQRIFDWFAAPPKQNLVVRARAGTGKTTTIIEAIQHIKRDVAEPPSVMVCAFNKRIQLELARRLENSAEAITLHSLGYKFLRGAWGTLNVESDVEDERIERVLEEMSIGYYPWEAKVAVKKLIGIAKGAMPFGTIDQLANLGAAFGCETEDDEFDAMWVARIACRAMAIAKEPDARGRITFDDMLFIPVVNGYGFPLYDWIVIDEAQDMNVAQLMLAKKACKENGHIVVVGDDRQAIYGFRGADSKAVDRLKTELDAEELGLNTTYRCPMSVVEVAATIVDDISAAPDAPDGEVVQTTTGELAELVKPGDVILSRVSAPLVPLCLGFIRRGIPARIEGRDIGKLLAARVKKFKAKSIEDFLLKLAKWGRRTSGRIIASGRAVEQRLTETRDVEMTLEALTEGCETVNELLQRCETMFGDVAENGEKREMIVLSTVHKAKGLEWPRVFVLANTLYCFGRRPEDIEEANIHYVAVTRAKESLFLVRDGDVESAEMSWERD